MKVRILIIICILWIAGVVLYFNTTADGKNEVYNYDNDCVELSDGRYIISGSGAFSQYLFDIDKYYRIRKIYNVNDFCEDAKLDQIVYLDGFSYILITTDAQVSPRPIKIYNLIKLNEDMQRVGSSGWFNFSQSGVVSDLTLKDDVFAFTQISDDGNDVFVYPLPESWIDITPDVDEDGVRHVETLNYSDYFSSEVDGEIFYAVYVNGVLMKYENYSEEIPDAFFNTRAADVYNNKVLDYKQLILLNRSLFLNCIAVMILGIATILALYVMLIRRNRIAYMILVWEVMIAMNAIALIWIAGRSVLTFSAAAMILVVGSILGVAVLLLQNADLVIFINAMHKLSQGRKDIYKPLVVGGDINALWNSLFDLQRSIKDSNYRMFSQYEGYYKFAPKHIDNLFGRNSIVDVIPGASVKLQTTVGIIGSKVAYDNETANLMFSKIADMQAEDKGTMISANADISKIELVFDKTNNNVTDFALQLQPILSRSRTVMLLHNAELKYEVCGDGRQNVLVTRCDEAKEFFSYIDKLQDMGLNLLMTKEAYLAEASKPLVRYIGHISIECVQKDIEIYEVLDCMSERDRRRKVENIELLNEAMDHIRSKDYYFARNAFAKILQTDPYDEVSREYLFKCEQCLSLDNDKEIDFSLNK